MTDKTTTDTSNDNIADQEWSEVHQTLLMLNLAIAQIEYSMSDGDESVGVLTESFTSMAAGLQNMNSSLQTLWQQANIKNETREQLEQQCAVTGQQMQSAVMAFQFYDKLVQRLTHVRNSMGQLADLIADASRQNSPAEWQKLHQQIRSAYTMEQDRLLFDTLMSGVSLDQVLMQMRQQGRHNDVAEDDIELF